MELNLACSFTLTAVDGRNTSKHIVLNNLQRPVCNRSGLLLKVVPQHQFCLQTIHFLKN